MDYVVVGLLTVVVSVCRSLDFDHYRRTSTYRIVDLLINRHYDRFQEELQQRFAGPEGDSLSDKNSYEVAMQEVLTSLSQQFVVVQSALTDHVLIPQCGSPKRRAFMLQYRVLRSRDLTTRATVDDHLEYVKY